MIAPSLYETLVALGADPADPVPDTFTLAGGVRLVRVGTHPVSEQLEMWEARDTQGRVFVRRSGFVEDVLEYDIGWGAWRFPLAELYEALARQGLVDGA